MKTFLALLISVSSFAQSNSKVEGIILYKDDNDRAIADVGARIYILDIKKLPKSVNLSAVDSLLKIKFAINQVKYLDDPPEKAKQTLAQYKINSIDDAAFKAIDRRAYAAVDAFINNANTFKTICDGVGRYSIKAKDGPYYILIKSNNQTSLNLTEIKGQVFQSFIFLKPNQNSEFNTTFYKDY